MLNWKHTFRGGHHDYVLQSEAEERIKQLVESGERINRAYIHQLEQGTIGKDYFSMIQYDWHKYAQQNGIIRECNYKPPCS